LGFERNPGKGLEAIETRMPDLVLLDLTFDGTPQAGLSFISEAVRRWPDLTILVVSAQDQSGIIMKALDLGAVDYMVKDHSRYELLTFRVMETLKKARLEKQSKSQVEIHSGFVFGAGQVIIGKSAKMHKVYEAIERVAQNRSTVLIIGESGTGKELVARAIHARKGLNRDPFLSIDCGAIPKAVLESELFGVRSNYPGFHNKERLIGKLEAAGQGTLLLDEIGNMDVDLQSSLLRVLEEKQFTPLGNTTPLPLQAQVVASTNIDLDLAIRSGKFRGDLYYRLNEVPILVPSLRERKEDIPLLVQFYLDQHERLHGTRIDILPETLQVLMAYDWPGNVRELQKAMGRALTLCQSQYLTPRHFQPSAASQEKPKPDRTARNASSTDWIRVDLPEGALPLNDFSMAARRVYAKHILQKTKGNRPAAAAILGIDVRTLRRVLNARRKKSSH
jgi:DNA-binding NtrC family response regulator